MLTLLVMPQRVSGGEPLPPPRAASSCIWTGRLQAGPDQIPTPRGQRQSPFRAVASHRRACAALTNTMHSAVCAAEAALMDLADAALCAP